jgi:hypothetical protein
MVIKAGHEYLLTIDKSIHKDPIVWVNPNRVTFQYSTWGEIDKKIVKVKSKTRILTTYYIVSLVDLPEEFFYVPKNFLDEIKVQNTVKCTCEIYLLMNRGCQCGAFQKEKNLS